MRIPTKGIKAAGITMFAALSLLHPGVAAANGRFPLANQLVVGPTDASRILVRATFGILDSSDSGHTWSWICEDAVGYFGTEDPPIALTADGSAIVASSRGLAVSRDGGCSWSKRVGEAGTAAAIDVTVDPIDPHQAVALEATFTEGRFAALLVRTPDDGVTWNEIALLPEGAIAETIEIAPSKPDRLYVTARLNSNQLSVLLRSDDGGQTWAQFPMNLPAGASAFIGAVDPNDADTVYVRVRVTANTIGRVYVSRDAGATWNAIWMGAGDVAGFALSQDGTTVALGGPESNLLVAATSDMVFREVNPLRPSCLTWSGGRLLACGKEAVDQYSIGASDDGGMTFVPLMHFGDIVPRGCDSSTPAAICASSWGTIAETIGADAGTGDDGSAPIEPAKSDASHGCSAAGKRPSNDAPTWVAAAIIAWAIARARRAARGQN